MLTSIAWLYWNPPRNVFTVPFIDRPIAWYGICFVLGFILGYFLFIPLFSRFLRQTKALSTLDILNWPLLIKQIISAPDRSLPDDIFENLSPKTQLKLQSYERDTPKETIDAETKNEVIVACNRLLEENKLNRVDYERIFPKSIATSMETSQLITDRLIWFVVLGTLIGARLGAVFFYDFHYFMDHPEEIVKVWKGGLASHGGSIGLIFSIYLFFLYIKKWIPSLTFLNLLDFVSVPTALAIVFIRIGNFINQEILGTPTTLPWAVIFGNPLDGTAPVPRHPVQLYEAAAYLTIFFILFFLWKKKSETLPPGTLCGIILTLAFSARFILEFWKENIESVINSFFSIQAGQTLSIPFILLGLYLMYPYLTSLFKNKKT